MADDNESRDRHQKASYWMWEGYNDQGEVIVSPLAKFDKNVRIVKGYEETLDRDGNVIRSDLRILVDREIKVGSIIWLGDSDVTTPTSDFLQVIENSETPDIKARKFDRRIRVSRYGDSLPTINTP